uniref:Putative secreted protein n=1 Tax=Anopheles darlingi TaxID=43151 RepID=A0A2M4D9G3_ANODA
MMVTTTHTTVCVASRAVARACSAAVIVLRITIVRITAATTTTLARFFHNRNLTAKAAEGLGLLKQHLRVLGRLHQIGQLALIEFAREVGIIHHRLVLQQRLLCLL